MDRLLIEVALGTLAIYLFLVLMIQLVGRRMLSQLSAIDLIVVILLGSAVETSMVHASTSFRAGMVSFAVLIAANWLLAIAMAKSKRLRHVVGGGPVLLVHNGHLMHRNMERLGYTEDDLMEALRAREAKGLEEVRFAVVETDGRINVVFRDRSPGTTGESA